MKKQILIVLTSLCIFGCTENNQSEHLQSKVDSLQLEVDSLHQAMTTEKPTTDQSPAENPWYRADYDGKILLEEGVEDPAEYIESHLRERPELIPLEPVLGGTMRFINIQVLGSKWIIADYEDGHIQGR